MSKPASKPKGDRMEDPNPFFEALADGVIALMQAATNGKKKGDDIECVLMTNIENGNTMVFFGDYDQRISSCALFEHTVSVSSVKKDNVPRPIDYDTWFNKNLYYPGEPADFLTTFGVSIENSRKSKMVIWDASQMRIVNMVNAFDEDILATTDFTDLSFRSEGKTPDMALAKLKAKFGDKTDRIEGLLILCYMQGIYAPVGHFPQGKFNDKNMKKFFALTTLKPVQKAAVSKVFLELEIGAKDGFSLSHYIKAIRGKTIKEEEVFAENTGLLDYLFFDRTASIGYWAKYAIHYKNTVRDISKGANVKMKNKTKGDLKYDMYGDHNVAVGSKVDDSWMSEFNSDNAKTIYYFLCVKAGTTKYKKGKEILAEYVMEQFKTMLNLRFVENPKLSQQQNRTLEDEANKKRKDVMKKLVRVMKVDDLYKEMPRNPDMTVSIPLSASYFTEEERIVINIIGGRLRGGKKGGKGGKKAKSESSEDEDSEKFVSADDETSND